MSLDDLVDDDRETVVLAKEEVERRIDDWLRRLGRLYADIAAWAGLNGWSQTDGAPAEMHEDLMRQTGIRAREQPSLVLTAPGGQRVWVKPKGLWVIGANGRVDLYGPRASLVVVDTSSPYEPSVWIMHYLPTKGAEGQIFTPSILASLV